MRTVLPALLAATVWLGPVAGAPAVPRTVISDNRKAAGVLRDGVLTLNLEARLGEWHPDGDGSPGATLPAFAEEGGAPMIPGPLIRVPAGTTVEVSFSNALPRDTIVLHGLQDRTGSLPTEAGSAGMRFAPGERRKLRFRLDTPGTYYYWAATDGRDVSWRTGPDAQLTGAIVVDPAGAPPPPDRIFILGVWTDTVGRAAIPVHRLLAVINGRSWPHTERLSYQVGDTVHWRVINASGDNHPMHLHGFYFRVDGRGDALSDSRYAPADADREVTEAVTPGSTFDLTWVPERAGRWLFHCHIPAHVARRGPLGVAPAAMAHAVMHDATNGMNGLVMGIDVRPAPDTKAAPEEVRSPRRLRLLIRRNGGGSDDMPYYGFNLAAGEVPAATGLHVGPPLVLVRGEPVSVMVVNALAEPTSVHWHGIELESYYDGVAGFSGAGALVAPVIAPGDSFEARFTPPRAGTFIYHTHVDEERQEPAGLAGPIIVLDPDARWDPATDHPVMITSPWGDEERKRSVLVNGSPTPAPMALRSGVAHRLRFVNMTLNRPVLLLELRRDTTLLAWRELARDGADLPAAQRESRPARRLITIGQTLDVEIRPDAPGDYHLDLRLGGKNVPDHPLLARLPLQVTADGAP